MQRLAGRGLRARHARMCAGPCPPGDPFRVSQQEEHRRQQDEFRARLATAEREAEALRDSAEDREAALYASRDQPAPAPDVQQTRWQQQGLHD